MGPSRCFLGLQSESLTRVGRSSSKRVHSHGCWQEISDHHWLLVKSLSSSSYGSNHWVIWVSSWHGTWLPPEWGNQGRHQGRSCNAFYDSAWEVTHRHFCHHVFVRTKWLKGRGIRLYFLKGGISKNLWTYFENHHTCWFCLRWRYQVTFSTALSLYIKQELKHKTEHKVQYSYCPNPIMILSVSFTSCSLWICFYKSIRS